MADIVHQRTKAIVSGFVKLLIGEEIDRIS